jgi:hypothetical protein
VTHEQIARNSHGVDEEAACLLALTPEIVAELCADLHAAHSHSDLDAFVRSFSTLVGLFASQADPIHYHQLEVAAFISILRDESVSELVSTIFDTSDGSIDCVLQLVAELALIDVSFAELFVSWRLFQYIFQSPNCEHYFQLLTNLIPFERQFDPDLTILFDWFQQVAGSVAPKKVLTLAEGIMRNLNLNIDQIEILFRAAPSDDSVNSRYQVCVLAILALENDSDSLPFLMESVVPAVLTFAVSKNPELIKVALKMVRLLISIDEQLKWLVVKHDWLLIATSLVDSESEAESISGIDFLSQMLPEFVCEIVENISCDLLWAILSDGMQSGSFLFKRSCLRMTHRLIGLHDEFDNVFLTDDICALGEAICELDDSELISEFLEILDFAITASETRETRFMMKWSDSTFSQRLAELPDNFEPAVAALLRRIAALPV